MRTIYLAAALFCVSSALASDYEWVNVQKVPDDIQNTTYGWSAIRIDEKEFTSHRIAADDFVIEKPTAITEIGFWNVNIGMPPYRSGEWYIFSDDGGQPGDLLFAGPQATSTRTKTGYKNTSFGDVYLTKMAIKDVTLDPGTYWLAFRAYQGYLSGGKNNVGSLTTRYENGNEGYWNFEVTRDGSVEAGWQKMYEFTLQHDHQWAFYINGTIDDVLRGDMNCDTLINFEDIDGFVVALTGESEYNAAYPDCNFKNGDIDCNGAVNFEDIDGFVTCVVNGGCANCP